MNSQLDEEYGAGFEGTKELLYKYLKDTPGQKIVKYMDKTNTELDESITADTVEKITGAQIEKYIDSQNFKALDQISKFLTKDEYELWSKNGFEGRTFELLMKQRAKNVKEAVEKIACLKCDEVSTAAAWQKNKGFCPVCKTSSQGVAESEELQEMQELREFYSSIGEDVDEIFEGSGQIAQQALTYAHLLPHFGIAALAVLLLYGGPSKAASLSEKPPEEIKKQIELAKKRVDAEELRTKKQHIEKSLEKLKELQKDPKKRGLISKGLDFVKAKYKKAALKSVDTKLKPHLDREKDEKEADKQEYEKRDREFKAARARDAKEAEMEREAAKKAAKKTRRNVGRVVNAATGEVIKPGRDIVSKVKKEEVDLQTLRTMKIVSLATGCTDSEALYEYALTAPTYTSLVELKENFNRYIQDA